MGTFKDEAGAIRHAMSKEELNKLYRDLDNFIADLTPKEYQRNKESFIEVKAAIMQRERETSGHLESNHESIKKEPVIVEVDPFIEEELERMKVSLSGDEMLDRNILRHINAERANEYSTIRVRK